MLMLTMRTASSASLRRVAEAALDVVRAVQVQLSAGDVALRAAQHRVVQLEADVANLQRTEDSLRAEIRTLQSQTVKVAQTNQEQQALIATLQWTEDILRAEIRTFQSRTVNVTQTNVEQHITTSLLEPQQTEQTIRVIDVRDLGKRQHSHKEVDLTDPVDAKFEARWKADAETTRELIQHGLVTTEEFLPTLHVESTASATNVTVHRLTERQVVGVETLGKGPSPDRSPSTMNLEALRKAQELAALERAQLRAGLEQAAMERKELLAEQGRARQDRKTLSSTLTGVKHVSAEIQHSVEFDI